MASESLKRLFRSYNRLNRHLHMFWGSYYATMLFAESSSLNVHSSVDIRTPIQISAQRDLIIKEYCYIDAYGGYIHFDGFSAIGQFNMIAGQGGVRIGKYFMSGGHCYILSSNHVCDDLEIPYILQGDRIRTGVVIEDNVWMGGGSIILDGVRIGRNSIIAAGSIVARSIPPNSLYADRSPKLAKSVLHRIYEENYVNGSSK